MPSVPARETSCAERELRIEFPADAASIAEARGAVGGFARRLGLDDADIRLAVSEAVSNSVVHAFRGRRIGTVILICREEPEAMKVIIIDDGGGMRPNLESPGLGLGIPLITKLASQVNFDSSERGTTVSMTFAR
jgi:serine/threonine-protein kinase RsbW/stage II sporulation protein AB (anti-sigma F factor)